MCQKPHRQDVVFMWCAVGADKAALEDDNVTYLMNGQSLEALAFRVVSLSAVSNLLVNALHTA